MTGIRVLSVPSAHRYVDHLSAPGVADTVHRLPDPPVPGAAPGVWWPPQALTGAWVRRHVQDYDLVHVHFGFESFSPEQLATWTQTLAELERPLVLTVHDLTNPHLVNQHAHLQSLDVLVPAADAVITLTPGAAAAVEQRWGVPVQVVPHPHMAPLEHVGRPRERTGERLRAGVHLKSLRAHVDGVGVVDALAQACTSSDVRERVDLHVHVHHEVRDPEFSRHDPALVGLLDHLAQSGAATVHWVGRMGDEALWDYLRSLDVSVLPYAWGTHSGWLEECHDLGTAVLAPDIGFYREQGEVHTYRLAGGRPRVDDLQRGLLAVCAGPPRRVTAQERIAQRRQIAQAHRGIYDEVLAHDRGRVRV